MQTLRYLSEYTLYGTRFTQNNIDLRIQHALVDQSIQELSSPPAVSNPVETMQAIDDSGGYILQASIRVLDDSKPEVMSTAYNELQDLKDTLRGLVELDLGDRIAMNTRIR